MFRGYVYCEDMLACKKQTFLLACISHEEVALTLNVPCKLAIDGPLSGTDGQKLKLLCVRKYVTASAILGRQRGKD